MLMNLFLLAAKLVISTTATEDSWSGLTLPNIECICQMINSNQELVKKSILYGIQSFETGVFIVKIYFLDFI